MLSVRVVTTVSATLNILLALLTFRLLDQLISPSPNILLHNPTQQDNGKWHSNTPINIKKTFTSCKVTVHRQDRRRNGARHSNCRDFCELARASGCSVGSGCLLVGSFCLRVGIVCLNPGCECFVHCCSLGVHGHVARDKLVQNLHVILKMAP